MPWAIFAAFNLFTPAKHLPHFLLYLGISMVLFVALFAMMHRLPPRAKKWTTIILTFIAGLYFSVEFFWPTHLKDGERVNWLTPTIEPVSNFVIYIVVWTLVLGIISLALVHGRRLVKGAPGWHNSLALFLAMFGSMVVGFITAGGTRVVEKGQHGLALATTIYNSLYFGVLLNLDAAMFSLLAFYIASAAYRAFRVRTVEAGLLMGAALIVMLGMVNFGVMLTGWIPPDSPFALFRIEVLSQWILSWINMAAYRAVLIGVGIGMLAMGLRLWLSLERGTFFSQEG